MAASSPTVPSEIGTARLVLRPWRPADAETLHTILVANVTHLGPWIPARVATPASAEALAERLAGFATEFEAEREWRFAMLTRDGSTLLGEIDLFPRSAAARVHVAEADRVEIGYWIRADNSGRGFVTEAVRAMLGVASRISRFAHAEIRCDARNAPSAAIPRRLGFHLSETIEEPPDEEGAPGVQLQVWSLGLRSAPTQGR